MLGKAVVLVLVAMRLDAKGVSAVGNWTVLLGRVVICCGLIAGGGRELTVGAAVVLATRIGGRRFSAGQHARRGCNKRVCGGQASRLVRALV